MAKQIIIRQAAKKDLPVLRKMNAEHFLLERTEYDKTLKTEWLGDERQKAHHLRGITGPDSVAFLAQDGDQLVGYVECLIWKSKNPWRTIDTRAEIINIFTDKKYRGQKIGSRLIKKVMSWARGKKVGAVFVDPYVVNLRAIKFYRRNGFADYKLCLEARLRGKKSQGRGA